MVKGRAAPPKYLFHVATQIENLIYSSRTISTFSLVKNWHLLTPRVTLANTIKLYD